MPAANIARRTAAHGSLQRSSACFVLTRFPLPASRQPTLSCTRDSFYPNTSSAPKDRLSVAKVQPPASPPLACARSATCITLALALALALALTLARPAPTRSLFLLRPRLVSTRNGPLPTRRDPLPGSASQASCWNAVRAPRTASPPIAPQSTRVSPRATP
ncbi:hypothetical protein PMIN03_009448 [Paraphaeosphaeria minitans]